MNGEANPKWISQPEDHLSSPYTTMAQLQLTVEILLKQSTLGASSLFTHNNENSDQQNTSHLFLIPFFMGEND